MKVSILVCTRDRPEDLQRCVLSIVANDFPDLEVIVVDQGSDDRGAEALASSLKSDPRISYERQTTVGKSKALNRALALSNGDVVLHTDDDCTVPADWVQRSLSILENDPGVGIVFGALGAPEIDWSKSYIPTFRPESYRRFQGRIAFMRVPKIGVGANMAVRREVYDRIKGFDECLGPGCRFRSGDEWDMAYRAMKAGFAAVHDPDNVVTHWGERIYADGSGRRLLRNKYYGVGAGYAKHIRCGDPVALLALGRAVTREMVYLGANLIKHRRATGAGRLWSVARGIFDGMRHPIDRRNWLYVPAQETTTP